MIGKEDYLRDPCGTLSIPLWKWKAMTLPEGMKILHHRDYTPAEAAGYQEERYFRLYHPLDRVTPVALAGVSVRMAREADIPVIAEIINASYRDISVPEAQVAGWRNRPVYEPELWCLAEDSGGRPIGCAIADLDRETGEGILEWVQVLPEYRGKGIGTVLVTWLLAGMQGMAAFATVSGKEPAAERLYRRCGFRGQDVWHILKK